MWSDLTTIFSHSYIIISFQIHMQFHDMHFVLCMFEKLPSVVIELILWTRRNWKD
jgi:hypothetical protein